MLKGRLFEYEALLAVERLLFPLGSANPEVIRQGRLDKLPEV
jgi:hypothetical protein